MGNIWQMNLKTCFSIGFPKEVKEPESVIRVVRWVRNSLKHCGLEESEKSPASYIERALTLQRVWTPKTGGLKLAAQMGGEEDQEARTGLFGLFPLLGLPLACVCGLHHFPRYQSKFF